MRSRKRSCCISLMLQHKFTFCCLDEGICSWSFNMMITTIQNEQWKNEQKYIEKKNPELHQQLEIIILDLFFPQDSDENITVMSCAVHSAWSLSKDMVTWLSIRPVDRNKQLASSKTHYQHLWSALICFTLFVCLTVRCLELFTPTLHTESLYRHSSCLMAS